MLRTPILSVGPAQKVNSWLDQMRTVRMVAEILSSPICTHEVPLWERDHEQTVSHHQSMPQAEQIQSLPRRRDDNSRSSVYEPSDRSDVSEPELNIIGMEGATPLSSAMWSNNEDRTGASVLECTCSHQGEHTNIRSNRINEFILYQTVHILTKFFLLFNLILEARCEQPAICITQGSINFFHRQL